MARADALNGFEIVGGGAVVDDDHAPEFVRGGVSEKFRQAEGQPPRRVFGWNDDVAIASHVQAILAAGYAKVKRYMLCLQAAAAALEGVLRRFHRDAFNHDVFPRVADFCGDRAALTVHALELVDNLWR